MSNKTMLIDGVKFELTDDYMSIEIVSSFAGSLDDNSDSLLPSFHLTYEDMEYDDMEVVSVVSSNLVTNMFKDIQNFDDLVEKTKFLKKGIEIQAYDFSFEDIYSDELNEKLGGKNSIHARIAEDVNTIIPFTLNILLTSSDLKNITDLFEYVSDNIKLNFDGSVIKIFNGNYQIEEPLDLNNERHQSWINDAINSESSEVFAYAIYLISKKFNQFKNI